MNQNGGKIHQPNKQLLLIFYLSLVHHAASSPADGSPIDTDDFKDILLHTDTYVDKTSLIEEFALDKALCKIIHRPQRWGKTLNLNMLARFFELETYPNGTILPDDLKQNRKFFTGGEYDIGGNKTKLLKPLRIASHLSIMKHQGQYPVIFLNLKNVSGDTFEEFQLNVEKRVGEVYAKFKYLNTSQSLNTTFMRRVMQRFLVNDFHSCDTNVMMSLNFLSKCLFKHFGKKVMIFVDDYDDAVLQAYQRYSGSEPGKYAEVLGFMHTMYTQTFHFNENLENSLASGTIELPLSRGFHFYCLYDTQYSQFYGFSQPELENLLANVSFTPDFEKIRDWYGYKYSESGIVYNPGSIMRYIARNGSFEYSWVDLNRTGIDGVLLSRDLQPEIRNLSIGLSITCLANFTDALNNFNLIVKPSDVYVILLFSGIIAPIDGKWNKSDRHEMVAANLEIRHLLQFKAVEWATHRMNLTNYERVEYFAYRSKYCPFEWSTSEPLKVIAVTRNITNSNATGVTNVTKSEATVVMNITNSNATTKMA